MLHWTDLGELPYDATPSVVSVGNFDGVHRGHAEVLGHARLRADATGMRSVVVTFSPHPMQVVRPELAPDVLTPLPERLALLEQCGVDATLVLQFTPEVSSWSPTRFMDDVLVRALTSREVVVGEDFRFGARGAGTVDDLRKHGATVDFGVTAVEDVMGAGRRWSSSWVRDLLFTGNVTEAAEVLGRPHRVVGVVVHGDHRGRELGFPTANMDAENLVPADGIYAGWLVRDGLGSEHPDRRLPAAISVGTNPTFDGSVRRCEVYALDRTDLDLYGERIGAEFVTRLRGTERYDSVDDLVAQMNRDVAQCRDVLVGV